MSSQYETTNGFSTISGSFFLTVGDYGTILTSPDGTTWTSRNYGENIGFSGVTYANSTFFVVGNDDILSSTDGISWTSSNTGIYSNESLVDLAYGNNLFVVQEITKDVEGYLAVKNLMARPECNNKVSILVSI